MLMDVSHLMLCQGDPNPRGVEVAPQRSTVMYELAELLHRPAAGLSLKPQRLCLHSLGVAVLAVSVGIIWVIFGPAMAPNAIPACNGWTLFAIRLACSKLLY